MRRLQPAPCLERGDKDAGKKKRSLRVLAGASRAECSALSIAERRTKNTKSPRWEIPSGKVGSTLARRSSSQDSPQPYTPPGVHDDPPIPKPFHASLDDRFLCPHARLPACPSAATGCGRTMRTHELRSGCHLSSFAGCVVVAMKQHVGVPFAISKRPSSVRPSLGTDTNGRGRSNLTVCQLRQDSNPKHIS